MAKLYSARFKELRDEIDEIFKTRFKPDSEKYKYLEYVNYKSFKLWRIKARHLLEDVAGKESIYFQEFDTIYQKYNNDFTTFTDIIIPFRAIYEDYEAGYIKDKRNIIQAEIFDSELEQAKELFLKRL